MPKESKLRPVLYHEDGLSIIDKYQDRAVRMAGIIKKVNRQGAGIIAVANGSRVPFVRSDVLNPIKPGERVVFSLRIAKGKMFACNIVPMPINR